MKYILAAFLFCSLAVSAQEIPPAASAPRYVVVQTTAPATCARGVGTLWFDPDATSGQQLYACTSISPVTWTLQGDGLGSGSFGETSLATLVNNQTLWDSSQASRLLTFGLSGASDPVITLSNGVLNLSTGDLQVGGISILPSMSGKGLYAYKANSGGTATEWILDTPGAGMSKTRVGSTDVWAVDSTQVPYTALNNAFLGNNTFIGVLDFTGASAVRMKTGTAVPGTCTVGDTFFDTDATAGLNWFGCTATNTWTLLGDGTGSGSFGESSLAGLANNQTLWDSANASRTLTAGLSGANDPVITFSNNLINVSTGALQVGGVPVATAASGGSLTTSGAYAVTLTATGATNVTLPTTGTLATTSDLPSNPALLPTANDTDNAVMRAHGTSGRDIQKSGCTLSDLDVLTCPGGFVAGTSGTGVVTLLEGTAPGAGASAGEHTLYFDSTGSLLKSHENGGSVVTYYSTANLQPTVAALAANGANCSGTVSLGVDASGACEGTATPTLGTAGSVVGSVAFANATSGTVTIQPPTGALGSAVVTLPGVTGTLALLASPSFTTPTLGVATATSINKWAFTAPTTAATLTAGGDNLTYTMPAASDTMVGRASTDTLTNKTLTAPVIGAYTVATLPVAGTANRVAIVTDASTAGSCTSGGGSARSWCRDTGSAWEPIGDGTAGGSMVYPGAGLAVSTGSAWATSITDSSTVGQVLRVTGASTYGFGALDLADADAITGTLPAANVHSDIARLANPVFTGSVALPQGTGPTIDAAGEIAVDTTTDQLQFYGGAKRALPSIQHFSFVIAAPVAADDPILMKAPYGMTILTIKGVLQGTTNVIGQLQECDSTGASCADLDSDITFNGGEDADDGALTDSTITSGNWLAWKTTSVSGTPTFLTVTITYRVTAD